MEELLTIKKQVENLNLVRQREILKIFIENDISISENKNGSFINLSLLSSDVLIKLKDYIQYIDDQEETISEIESIKQEFEESYFNKDNKEKNDNNDNGLPCVQTM